VTVPRKIKQLHGGATCLENTATRKRTGVGSSVFRQYVGRSSMAERWFVDPVMRVRFSSITPNMLAKCFGSTAPCQGGRTGSTPVVSAIFLLSTSVVQLAVNEKAAGSIPAVGAIFGDRLTVGHHVLSVIIGVRIPVTEPGRLSGQGAAPAC
jgi:hypothetical protein